MSPCVRGMMSGAMTLTLSFILQQTSIVEYQAGDGGKRLADLVDQLTLE